MITDILKHQIAQALHNLYQVEVKDEQIALEQTKPDFEGDFTFVVFPYLKQSKKGPEQTAKELGAYLLEQVEEVASYNVIKGFLNLVVAQNYWVNFLSKNYSTNNFGFATHPTNQKILVEYSSPNTNKPLHLGHIRNNLLGYAVSQILKANAHEVYTCNLVNDRGIHICKSMLAWMQQGNGETPASSGLKGDHLVGKYYVMFDKQLKKETSELITKIKHNNFDDFHDVAKAEIKKTYDLLLGYQNERERAIGNIDFGQFIGDMELDYLLPENSSDYVSINWKEALKKVNTPVKYEQLKNLVNSIILIEEKIEEVNENLKGIVQNHTQSLMAAQELLRKWEAGDEETVNIWKTMNGWVYEGFDVSYKTLGISFDKFYYESNTYLLGKEIVEEGLQKDVFYKKDDGSVWIDLTADGLDNKLVLRADGTSVYITQDMGTSDLKYTDFGCNQSIYVVGNEQDYHFKVLQLILKKLGRPYADGIYHLSYGMVELPEGKMKSREGTVVDADDLMEAMIEQAAETTKELGKTDGLGEEELNNLYNMIGLGALKYFILKVDPKKKMLFNPKESIDFQGNTGPFIQYTHARIKSVLRNAQAASLSMQFDAAEITLSKVEKELLVTIYKYPEVLAEAGKFFSPGVLCNYVYDLAKIYSHFYHEHSVLKETNINQQALRLQLCTLTADIIRSSFSLLGIQVPERM